MERTIAYDAFVRVLYNRSQGSRHKQHSHRSSAPTTFWYAYRRLGLCNAKRCLRFLPLSFFCQYFLCTRASESVSPTNCHVFRSTLLGASILLVFKGIQDTLVLAHRPYHAGCDGHTFGIAMIVTH